MHTALTIASKTYIDKFERNTIFYAVGGLTKRQMRSMTDLFMDMMEFKLIVDESEYGDLLSKIKRMIARKY